MKNFMKTPGYLKDPLFYLRILTTCTVLSTVSLMSSLVGSTSAGNTSGHLESSRGKSRRVKSESDWKKYYGSSDELNQERKALGNLSFRRTILSVWDTKGLVNYEETRQLFLNNVLCESLNEEPAFYNSNILGRYMRKDYYGKGSTTSTEDV